MADTARANGDRAGFDGLLEHLKSTRGFDFSGYKPGTLERRIQKRMEAVDADGYEAYRDHLEVNPDEFTDLFNTILINVTSFFRDEPAWDFLAKDVIPKLLEGRADHEPIRVWSAGCASGEEPYSVAMLLAEAMGEEDFRKRVKIYATDVDEDALAQARLAVYPREALKGMAPDLREKYFEAHPSGFAFRNDLRRCAIFGRNDLVQDAPISRIDLLVSRNALMYFTAETQSRILGHLNFALREDGFLFLGKSEMLITHTDLFVPHDLKRRVFQKVPQGGLRARLSFVGGPLRVEDAATGATLPAGALEASPLAQLVVDRAGRVASVNASARDLFGLDTRVLGRPFQDLDVSFRPAELRAGIEAATDTRAAVRLGHVPWKLNGQSLVLDVVINPFLDGDDSVAGVAVGFDDVTEQTRLDAEHRDAKGRLETAYDELQSTVEELETTNEELHSTNEELETTNEELQSTNEELETMNEELESTNHELETMNDEQNERSSELNHLSSFLEGVLESLGVGIVVVGTDLRVLAWNGHSEELWGMRSGEAEGEHFLSLDIGLPVDQLGPAVKAALGSSRKTTEQTLDARSRRGKDFRCSVRALPMVTGGDLFGVLLLMTDADSRESAAIP